MRARARVALIVAGSLASSIVAASTGAAAPSTTPSPVPAGMAAGPDFDGDGFADAAIGAPGECIECVMYSSGAVHVAYGSSKGLTLARQQRFWPGDPGMVGDGSGGREFGRRLGWADFDADGFDDLAVGAPHEVVDEHIEAGTVRVLYGSPNGLRITRNQLWSLAGPALPGDPGDGDLFGLDLATGDFDGDGYDDLAVLSGDRDANGVAPSIRLIYGSTDGLVAARSDVRRPANYRTSRASRRGRRRDRHRRPVRRDPAVR